MNINRKFAALATRTAMAAAVAISITMTALGVMAAPAGADVVLGSHGSVTNTVDCWRSKGGYLIQTELSSDWGTLEAVHGGVAGMSQQVFQRARFSVWDSARRTWSTWTAPSAWIPISTGLTFGGYGSAALWQGTGGWHGYMSMQLQYAFRQPNGTYRATAWDQIGTSEDLFRQIGPTGRVEGFRPYCLV